MIGITLVQVKAGSTSENIQEKEPTIFLFFCTDQKNIYIYSKRVYNNIMNLMQIIFLS